MAGDWIKLQHVTLEKPEIFQIADILGIDSEVAFAKCVRLWIWADQQSINGNAITVTFVTLDRITKCDGFAKALKKVGWLGGVDGLFLFTNFERHNGETAKSRAMGQKRTEKHRNSGNAENVTSASPEKRREEKRREEGGKENTKTASREGRSSLGATPDPMKSRGIRVEAGVGEGGTTGDLAAKIINGKRHPRPYLGPIATPMPEAEDPGP